MTAMLAQQRYATLQLMGTRLWVPRVRLPGAAPSPVCDWPLPQPQMSARERLLQEQRDAGLEALPEPPRDVAIAVPAPVTPPPSAVVARSQPTVTPAPEPRLPPADASLVPVSLQVWLLANGWQLVLDEVPSAPELKLLHQLLMALYPGTLGSVSQELFRWPLPGIPVMGDDGGEMLMALQAFLSGARFQQMPRAGVLIFGERLAALAQSPVQVGEPRVFQAPSLSALMQHPALKRRFWQEAGDSGLRAVFASSPVVF